MPYHKQGAYDGFDSVAEAKQHYKRARTTKYFILSDKGVTLDNPICVRCHKRIADDDAVPNYRGNRCEYLAQFKKVICYHYTCAWESIFNKVFELSDMM